MNTTPFRVNDLSSFVEYQIGCEDEECPGWRSAFVPADMFASPEDQGVTPQTDEPA